MTAYRGDPFLRECWEGKTQREKTNQTFQEKAWKIYQTIEEIAQDYPDLRKFIQDIRSGILRYGRIIKRRIKAIETFNRQEVEISDQEQRLAHNALIDSLNILSRQCLKGGISNSWRQSIGLEREQITDWAMKVYKILEEEEENIN